MRLIQTELGPLRVVSTPAEAVELYRWTRERHGWWLGLDAETNAHDPFAPSYLLRTVQIADESSVWVIQVQRPGMAEVVRDIVAQHDRYVAWFSRNDINFIERGAPGAIRFGQREPHVADGQVALAFYDPRTVTTASKKDSIDPRISRPRGLKPAAALNLGFDALTRAETAMHARFREIAPKGYRSQDAYKAYGFEHIDDNEELYLVYAGLDSIVAVRLWNKMLAEIYRRGQGESFENDLRLQWHYDWLQFRGLPIDGPYSHWLTGALNRGIDSKSRVLDHYYIPRKAQGPNIGKAFEWLGVESPKKTKTGAPSWDKTVLSEIKATAPLSYAGILASAILDVRKDAKYLSSYVRWMTGCLECDGRLHPDLRAIGTISSRNSARWPPLQQLPKKDKRIRAALAAHPGWVIVTADLEQGEPRTMAGLSGDKNLQHDLLEGDLYSAIAVMTYGDLYKGKEEGKEPGTASYIMRQKAKFAFLAWTYACAARKLAELLSVSVTEARQAIARWEDRYPDLVRYRNRLNSQAAVTLDSGWVAPLWDRYYVDADGLHLGAKPSRLGLNYSTQGNQRFIFATAIHRIIDWGWSWSLYWVMHDEIVLCVPEHMAAQAAQVLKAAMTMDFHGVPITCEVDGPDKWGKTWMPQPAEYWKETQLDLAELSEENNAINELLNQPDVDDTIARILEMEEVV